MYLLSSVMPAKILFSFVQRYNKISEPPSDSEIFSC